MTEQTKQPDQSEATARLILQHYVESVTADVGGSIEAILLVGSLATGSYVPGPGDIDQITILHSSTSPEIEQKVLQHIDDSMAVFGRAIHFSTVVYRRSDLERPWRNEWDYRRETKHLVCVPEELLRIHDHGQILDGPPFEISQLPKPTREEIITYHERWRRWNQAVVGLQPEIWCPEEGSTPLRIVVQTILSSAIWHYYYATGRTCFNKHQIALCLRNEVPHYRLLEGVELATRIRTSGFEGISGEMLESLHRWYHCLRRWNEAQPVGFVPLHGEG
jgi:hypothetical protein